MKSEGSVTSDKQHPKGIVYKTFHSICNSLWELYMHLGNYSDEIVFKQYNEFSFLTLSHSERPKFHRVLAVLSTIGLKPTVLPSKA